METPVTNEELSKHYERRLLSEVSKLKSIRWESRKRVTFTCARNKLQLIYLQNYLKRPLGLNNRINRQQITVRKGNQTVQIGPKREPLAQRKRKHQLVACTQTRGQRERKRSLTFGWGKPPPDPRRTARRDEGKSGGGGGEEKHWNPTQHSARPYLWWSARGPDSGRSVRLGPLRDSQVTSTRPYNETSSHSAFWKVGFSKLRSRTF